MTYGGNGPYVMFFTHCHCFYSLMSMISFHHWNEKYMVIKITCQHFFSNFSVDVWQYWCKIYILILLCRVLYDYYTTEWRASKGFVKRNRHAIWLYNRRIKSLLNNISQFIIIILMNCLCLKKMVFELFRVKPIYK